MRLCGADRSPVAAILGSWYGPTRWQHSGGAIRMGYRVGYPVALSPASINSRRKRCHRTIV